MFFLRRCDQSTPRLLEREHKLSLIPSWASFENARLRAAFIAKFARLRFSNLEGLFVVQDMQVGVAVNLRMPCQHLKGGSNGFCFGSRASGLGGLRF